MVEDAECDVAHADALQLPVATKFNAIEGDRGVRLAARQAGSTLPVTNASAVAPLVLQTLWVHPLGR
jgi:hypothetical protein